MNQVMSLKAIKRQYAGEWVLIAYVAVEYMGEVPEDLAVVL